MDKLKYYAKIFGGTLSRIAECDGLSELKNERLDQSIEYLDKFIENKFKGSIPTDIVNWLNSDVLDTILNGTFDAVCQNGHLELAKLMYSMSIHNLDDRYKSFTIFRDTCANGQLETAKWLVEIGVNILAACNNVRVLRDTCENGELEVAQWLVENGVDPHNDIAFVVSCVSGNLELVQWLYTVGKIDIHTCNDEALPRACRHGYIDIVQWLISKGIKLCVSDEYNYYEDAFIEACEYGHLEIAKLLVEYDRGFCENDYDALRAACHEGNLEMAKFVYSILIKGTFHLDDIILDTCYTGCLDILQWIDSFEKIDNLNELFISACENGYIDIVQWLIEEKKYKFRNTSIIEKLCLKEFQDSDLDDARKLCDKMHLELDNKGIVRLYMLRYLDIAKYLYSIKKVNPYTFKSTFFQKLALNGNVDVFNWIHEILLEFTNTSITGD